MRSIIVLTILFALLAGSAAAQAGTPPPGQDLQQTKASLEAAKTTLKPQACGSPKGLTITETEQTVDGKKVKVIAYTCSFSGACMTITQDEQGNVLSAQMSHNGQVTPMNVKVEDGQIKLSLTYAATGSFLQVTLKSDGGIVTELATSTGQVLKTELSSQGSVVSDTVVDTKTKTELTTAYNPDGSKTVIVADLTAGKAQTTEVDPTGKETILPPVDIPAIPPGATYCTVTGQWEV